MSHLYSANIKFAIVLVLTDVISLVVVNVVVFVDVVGVVVVVVVVVVGVVAIADIYVAVVVNVIVIVIVTVTAIVAFVVVDPLPLLLPWSSFIHRGRGRCRRLCPKAYRSRGSRFRDLGD